MLIVNTLNMHSRYNGLGKSERKTLYHKQILRFFSLDAEQLHYVS